MKHTVSVRFMMMCVLMTVCLIASNIFTTKVFTLWGLALTCDLLIFPVSYIINDGISEVYGYRLARLSIWVAFLMNFFVVAVAQAVMSLMKRASHGRNFPLRSIVSSIAGDLADSLIFMPIVFWSVGFRELLMMIACQVLAKLVYEVVLLPLTQYIVKVLKNKEGIDVIDNGISYNPFHVLDI